jgi:hypothetical protein
MGKAKLRRQSKLPKNIKVSHEALLIASKYRPELSKLIPPASFLDDKVESGSAPLPVSDGDDDFLIPPTFFDVDYEEPPGTATLLVESKDRPKLSERIPPASFLEDEVKDGSASLPVSDGNDNFLIPPTFFDKGEKLLGTACTAAFLGVEKENVPPQEEMPRVPEEPGPHFLESGRFMNRASWMIFSWWQHTTKGSRLMEIMLQCWRWHFMTN